MPSQFEALWNGHLVPRNLPITRAIRSVDPTFNQEPISLAEARKQCGVGDVNYHDDHLKRLIIASREQVELDTGLICYTGAFVWKFTEWPCVDWFELPLRPVTSVTSIQYIDTSGATQTWNSSSYVLETSGVQQFVRLAYLQYWPVSRYDINAVTVTLVAGYASVLAIPQRIKTAALLQLQLQWSQYMGDDTTKLQAAYDRYIDGPLLRRSSYP